MCVLYYINGLMRARIPIDSKPQKENSLNHCMIVHNQLAMFDDTNKNPTSNKYAMTCLEFTLQISSTQEIADALGEIFVSSSCDRGKASRMMIMKLPTDDIFLHSFCLHLNGVAVNC